MRRLSDQGRRRAMALRILLAFLLAVNAAIAAELVRRWIPLARDGIHDPRGPALSVLQEPAEALSRLPPGQNGNQVDWVAALEENLINPRTNIFPETKVRVLDSDFLFNRVGSHPIVRFPHRAHTLWLDCNNCHEHLFKSQAGANNLSKLRILQGEQCGLCHGAVAFPLTECTRCHSVPRQPALPTGSP